MPTLDALNQQLNTYNTSLEYATSEITKQEKVLNTIKAGLLDYTAIGEEVYFKQTGTERLEKKEVPRYTDIYNKEFYGSLYLFTFIPQSKTLCWKN